MYKCYDSCFFEVGAFDKVFYDINISWVEGKFFSCVSYILRFHLPLPWRNMPSQA